MKKLMNKKGFTLMEMLIVVAIIVILVAIAIPTFSSSLDDAKAATDAANLRGAKGIAEVADMTAGGWANLLGSAYDDTDKQDTAYTLIYDIEKGTFVEPGSNVEGYGQSTEYKGMVIKAVLDKGSLKEGYPKFETP